jgi:hypothetical protein
MIPSIIMPRVTIEKMVLLRKTRDEILEVGEWRGWRLEVPRSRSKPVSFLKKQR